jgi:hypothetical protein
VATVSRAQRAIQRENKRSTSYRLFSDEELGESDSDASSSNSEGVQNEGMESSDDAGRHALKETRRYVHITIIGTIILHIHTNDAYYNRTPTCYYVYIYIYILY